MAKAERNVLVRTESFFIKPTSEQAAALQKINDNLWQTWDEHLHARQKHTELYHEPLFAAIKEAYERNDNALVASLRADLKKAYKDHPQPSDFDQINLLTQRRAKDPFYAKVNRNWQEETLKLLYGAYVSFMTLRRNGDPKAKPPREKDPNVFCGILGRSGFRLKRGMFEILCGKIAPDAKLAFRIPEHQCDRIARGEVKSFTLDRDEAGRFKVGINYEFPKPEAVPFTPEEAVYVALGAWSIGIVSQKGEMLLPLGRPDVHWKPRTDAIVQSFRKKGDGTNVHALTKGSRTWRKLEKKRKRMFGIMAAQQKQGRRETVARDLIGRREIKRLEQVLFHGVHFVVSELVVRSKKGKLADSSKPERGGPLGANWSAQNTGAIAYLVQWLEEKAAEYGGSVRKHRLPAYFVPKGEGDENKVPMARALRDDFLKSYREQTAA